MNDRALTKCIHNSALKNSQHEYEIEFNVESPITMAA